MTESQIAAAVVWLTELIKNIWIPTKYRPALAIIISILLVLWDQINWWQEINYYASIMKWLIIWASVTWIYKAADKMITKQFN